MGNVICKKCNNRTSTVTCHCEHCLSKLYSDRELKVLFAVAMIGTVTAYGVLLYMLCR